MATSSTCTPLKFFFFSILLVSLTFSSTDAARRKLSPATTDFIQTACRTTPYPQLCYNSLQSYSSTIQRSRRQLAQAAFSVSLDLAELISAKMSELKHVHRLTMSHREAGAMKDCIENVGESIYLMKQSLKEMDGRGTTVNWGEEMNDLQTWVSAALTDQDTCMDGFGAAHADGVLKEEVGSSMQSLSQLTSNALDFINQLANRTSRGGIIP